MIVRTARDIGALIRDRRKRLALDQQTLATRAGVSRKWLIAVEQGKTRAELGLVLRTLDTLGLEVVIEEVSKVPSKTEPEPDIDEIVKAARKKSR